MVGACRRALERQYRALCSIYLAHKEMVDGRMEYRERVQVEGIPCHLSFKTVASAGEVSPASAVAQTVKVFLALEVEVSPGSKLVITQNGRTEAYKRSGQPAVYPTHQEIVLELFKGWA